MMAELVLVERGAGYHSLTLNRPDRLNALDATLVTALGDALEAAAADPTCRAVVLTGAGRGFCAGADLAATQGDLGEMLERRFNPVVRRIGSLPKPVICAVNGVAAGAGANIALACDIVLAARSARFLQAFVKIGLVPDCGGTWLLPRLVGEARARGMAMLGNPVSAQQALEWGMVWQVVEDAALMPEAQALAAQLATQPTAALAQIKQLIDGAAATTLDQQLDAERDAQRIAGRSPDYTEGVQAFLEKRPARFTGRPG